MADPRFIHTAAQGEDREPVYLFDRRQAKRRGDFLINLLYLVTWTVLVGGCLWLVGKWLFPFVIAFFTAAMLQRPVRWLTGKTRASRGFLSSVLVVGTVLFVAGVTALLGWWLWRSVVGFLGNEELVARFSAALTDTMAALKERLTAWSMRLSPATRAALQAAFGNLLSSDGGLVSGWLGTAASDVLAFAANQIPGFLFGFVIWVMASVFLTVDYHRVTAFFMRQIPAHRQPLAQEIRQLFSGTILQLLRAYGRLMLLTFAELTAGLLLLRIPYAPLWAALIAVVDILPVLGVGTVLVPWGVISLLIGQPAVGAGLLVLYVVITVVRNAVEPHWIGEKMGLPPLVTLVCLYAGWQVAGLAGVVLAPLAVTILVQLQRRGYLPLWK